MLHTVGVVHNFPKLSRGVGYLFLDVDIIPDFCSKRVEDNPRNFGFLGKLIE